MVFTHFVNKFRKIENDRNDFVKSEVNSYALSRKHETQKLIIQIQAYNFRITQENNKIVNQVIHAYEQQNIQKQEALKIQNTIQVDESLTENKQQINNTENTNISFTENEKIEIVENNKLLTNIPFSEEFIQKYILNYQIHKTNNLDSNAFQAKRIINKRISQVSTDLTHIKGISRDIVKYADDYNLANAINSVFVQQGKIQVALHNDSYKGYAYLFSLIYNDNLMHNFRYRVFTESVKDHKASKGVYLIYFGVLKLMKFYDEAWFFFASMMNVKPIEKSLYILEGFLTVLSSDLFKFYGSEYPKVKHFIVESYCQQIENRAILTRIKTLMDKCSLN